MVEVQKTNTSNVKDNRRRLVETVASSHYLAKSARLREMFVYLCDQVLEHAVDEIHEQEVGREVFGRPADYDTSADNTVRVHASTLRKRIDQYFATEGSTEPIVIEIPRGNYAPVFRDRPVAVLQPGEDLTLTPPVIEPPPAPQKSAAWKFWLPVALAGFFALLSLFLFLSTRSEGTHPGLFAGQPTVAQFGAQIFPVGKQTDVVIGDASLGSFQEMTDHHPVALSEYFDRSYLSKVVDRANAAKLDPALASTLTLKRQSSYGEIQLLQRFADMAHGLKSDTKVRFARDYSFRELKTNNIILLGYRMSNPWIEPFESHLTLRWNFDPAHSSYYPVDTTIPDQQKFALPAKNDQPHEGYATLSFVPNLSNTGNVLIISGTGGSATGAAVDFLQDERSMAQLHSQLTPDKNAAFPFFEALLRVGSRNTLPRDTSAILVRPLKP